MASKLVNFNALVIVCCMTIVFASVGTGWAQSLCRLYLAGQYDWERKIGFYLDLEGSKLAELPVILGIADGSSWRFPSHRPGFVFDRTYHIRAIITPERGQLFVDGKLVAESPGGFVPAPRSNLEVNHRPPWANEPGDWIGIAERIVVSVMGAGRKVAEKAFDFSRMAARPVQLLLFQPDYPEFAELPIQAGDTVVVEATLRFAPSDIKRWSPFIDAYGQCKYAEWQEKVRSDEDLKNDIAREEKILATMPPSKDYDRYGGYLRAGWKEKATGFFRVIKRDGKWWLITPDGNPCFYLGVCAVPELTWETTPISEREFLFEWLPPKEGLWGAAWARNLWGINDGTEYVCFYTCNLIRKYGSDWAERATKQAVRRLKCWGFSGGGKWGSPKEVVDVPVLARWDVPNLVEHPDIFDPAVQQRFRSSLERQIAPRRNDPMVLGWSLGNEYGELIKRGEIVQILQKPKEVAAKRALVDYALDSLYAGSVEKLAKAWNTNAITKEQLYDATDLRPPDQDVEKLRQFYADRYYEFIYRTVKEIDPNHLYFGFWIVPGWWENEQDWFLIARHCDVIGYDRYTREYKDEFFFRLEREAGKPTLCGEFSFPSWYEGKRGFGRYHVWAKDDVEAGELYRRFVHDAATDPFCVGLIWFLWRDQPLTGRGPGRGPSLVHGEHFAFGLITETDRPKWGLVRRMREANLNAVRWRLGGVREE